ncbi:polysaccharide deacetylase [Pseudidiomarina aestuarii]|uniref:Polysaccharide deacetylase n=1 Tax=Pseudidiomarina aestuarii TaxID=624146 RepID=A0A6N4DCR2_9GAMM|nr:polysaccharide deacetylase [Pseudidiomarina aestuarii]
MRVVGLWLAMLVSVPFVVLAKSTAATGVAILQYHHIGDDTPRVTSVTVEELEAHFEFLADNKFTVLSLTEAAERIETGILPERAAAITIDDGWRNVYSEGLELFQKYNYPFTIFVNPKLMAETPRLYMTWDQLESLQEYGATIANHSQSHSHMTWRLEHESEAEWLARQRSEVLAAQEEIDQRLGEQPKLFAYPYGEYNPQLAEMLVEEGFLAFAQHSGPWGEYSPTGAIPRFPASAQYANLETLKTKLLSLPLPVVQAKPESMIQSGSEVRPTVELTVEVSEHYRLSQMNCFYGSAVIQPQWSAVDEGLSRATIELPNDLTIGRSRLNCTVPSAKQNGRFYWYSHPFVRPDENGRWPD